MWMVMIIAVISIGLQSCSGDSIGPYAAIDTSALDAGLPLKEREQAIGYLLRILKMERDDYVWRAHRCSAAECLGRLRAAEATTTLIDNIDLTSSSPRLGALGKYPAAQALVEIGTPALRQIPPYCSHELSNKQIRLLAFVIAQIDGRELGRVRIGQILSAYMQEVRALANKTGVEQTDETKIRNLTRIIALLDDPDFEKRANWP